MVEYHGIDVNKIDAVLFREVNDDALRCEKVHMKSKHDQRIHAWINFRECCYENFRRANGSIRREYVSTRFVRHEILTVDEFNLLMNVVGHEKLKRESEFGSGLLRTL